MFLNIFLLLLFLATAKSNPSFKVDWDNNRFLRDGQPFRYISGDLEYFKVPSVLWDDRLAKHKAAGLNAIQTYVDWSFHEPERGAYNFTGDKDLFKFLEKCQNHGFVVILRPGPFINAERDFGGLPYWLLTVNPNMKLRTMDSTYIKEVNRWYNYLLPKLVKYLYKNGGPIITVQVENEYGCDMNCDFAYTSYLRDLTAKLLGNDVVLFTTDPPSDKILRCARIDNVLMTIDFGSGYPEKIEPEDAFGVLRRHQQKGPLVNSEFYPGWIDVWEDTHKTVPTANVCQVLDKILALNASVNLYPLHGGTSFGFGAGGKFDGPNYQPCVTSYDFDAPLTEAGDPTDKYFAVRDVILKYVPTPNASLPVKSPKMSLEPIKMIPIKNIFDVELNPIVKKYPQTFEAIGQGYGFVMYSTNITVNPTDPAVLTVDRLSDRAQVFVNRTYQGTLSRTLNVYKLTINAKKGQRLDILVENQGRIGFGPIFDPKGILSNVTIGKTVLQNWKHFRVFPDWEKTVSGVERQLNTPLSNAPRRVPTFFSGKFQLPSNLTQPLDSFLRLDGWGKGQAFLNGFNLGRYWPKAGPQVTLYTPAHLFNRHPQDNLITVFELEEWPRNNPSVRFVQTHVVNGTTPDS